MPIAYYKNQANPFLVRDSYKDNKKAASFGKKGAAILSEGWKTGLEPATPGTTNQCSNQLSYIHRTKRKTKLGNRWHFAKGYVVFLPKRIHGLYRVMVRKRNVSVRCKSMSLQRITEELIVDT